MNHRDSRHEPDELADRLRALLDSNSALTPLVSALLDQLQRLTSAGNDQIDDALYLYDAMSSLSEKAQAQLDQVTDDEVIALYRVYHKISGLFLLLAVILDLDAGDVEAEKLIEHDPWADSNDESADPEGDDDEPADPAGDDDKAGREFPLGGRTFHLVGRLADTLDVGRLYYPENQSLRCVLQSLPNEASDLERRRFALEATIGLEISQGHENLLTTLDFGEWRDSRLYIAHEHVKGLAISERWEALRGDYDTIRHIAAATASALTFMHARGVAHLAVAPENLLLGAQGAIRLGNFSKAKRTDAGGAQCLDRWMLSALILSMVIGRPVEYVPSEQVSELLPRDTPADIHELITGLAPPKTSSGQN